MANYFDQFDGENSGVQPRPAPVPSGNFFDQFDAAQPGGVSAGPSGRPSFEINPSGGPRPVTSADPQNIAAPGGMDRAFASFDGYQPDPVLQQRGQDIEQIGQRYGLTDPQEILAADRRAAGMQGMTSGILNEALQGATLGFGEEAKAGARALMGDGSYNQNLAAEREGMRRFERDNPNTALAAEIGGALLTAPLFPGVTVARGAPIAARIGAGAVTGAGYGAVSGFGSGEGASDRLDRAAIGGAVGSVLGGAIGGVTGRAPPPGGPTPGQNVALAGERQGIEIPRAAASDNMSVQRMGAAATNIPIAGNPLKRASETAIRQTGEAADRVAQDFGGAAGAASPASAGATARQGIERYVTETTTGRVKKAYDAVDKFIRPGVKTPLQSTRETVQRISARRSEAGLRGDGSAVDTVIDAVTREGGLTYQGIKTLRSRIGEMLNGGLLPADISQAELKQIYGALSQDLRTSVEVAGGPKALSAFERANSYNRLVNDRRENLMRIVGANNDEGVYERLVRAAGSTSTADIRLLTQARKALPADEWNEIASAVVARLGRDPNGEFSAQRFMTGYGKLSEKGKEALFRSTGRGDLAAALDDIATVSGRFKELQRFANPSGTGQTIAGGAALTGAFADPVTTVSTLLGAAVISRILASPVTAKSMANWSRAYEVAVKAPTRATGAAIKGTSRRFAADIGRELGLPQYTQEISRALQGAVNPYAGEDAPDAERVRDN